MTDTSYKSLKKYCYFSSLSDGALEAVSKKLHIIEVPEGAGIIKEGEIADSFYLVNEGEVEIIKKNKWGQTAKLSIIGHGEGFGEMALLTSSPRCCSVVAKSKVTLLKLYKTDFEEIVRTDYTVSELIQSRTRDFSQFNKIKTLQPFALLPPEKMAAIVNKLKEKTYPAGHKIITQGEKGQEYFIIKSGSVEVIKLGLDNEPEKMATLSEGEGFGEEALITDSPRNATIKTIDKVAVWVVNKVDFDEIMKASFLEEITQEDALALSKDSYDFLDVRMKIEYDEEHLPDAIHIPLDELRKRFSELDSSQTYYTYCLLGARSLTAAFLLNSQGLKAKSINGGILSWTGPVVEGENAEGVHSAATPT